MNAQEKMAEFRKQDNKKRADRMKQRLDNRVDDIKKQKEADDAAYEAHKESIKRFETALAAMPPPDNMQQVKDNIIRRLERMNSPYAWMKVRGIEFKDLKDPAKESMAKAAITVYLTKINDIISSTETDPTKIIWPKRPSI